MNPSTNTTTLIGILAVLAIVAAVLLSLSNLAKQNKILSINSFEDCARAGFPIMESYPEQCRTPDGRNFVNESQSVQPSPDGNGNAAGGTFPAGSCVTAGCSGTICADASEASDIVTTCEYRAEYACYKSIKCERQASGKCGWTETAEFKQCRSNPPALDANIEAVY